MLALWSIGLASDSENGNAALGIDAKSSGTRTPIPAQGGQQSGDCGQQVMAA
jgi:hypothetical protein